ncbi:MAG: hypothetical protein ABSB38_02105 [Dehalococcoidia bacterium]
MKGTIDTEDKLCSLMAELNTLMLIRFVLLPLETTLWPPSSPQQDRAPSAQRPVLLRVELTND